MRKLVPARVSCPILLARFHVRLNRIKYQTRNRAKNRTKKSFNVGNRFTNKYHARRWYSWKPQKASACSGRSREGPGGPPPLLLDQTEAWTVENFFFVTAPPFHPLISESGWSEGQAGFATGLDRTSRIVLHVIPWKSFPYAVNTFYVFWLMSICHGQGFNERSLKLKKQLPLLALIFN